MIARRRHLAAVLLAVVALGAGCVRLPDSGPVVEVQVDDRHDEQSATDKDARPPREGADRLQIVAGFLDAMTAWPIQINAAKEYLTSDAAEEWEPDSSMIVYSTVLPLSEVGGEVRAELATADHLDASGGWRGALAASRRTLGFQLTVEDGQFRIVNPPDALVVPASWFQERFRQVSVYYFDPTAQTLVPEPVFVPLGEQLATSLVSALLSGPPRRLRDVVTTFVPIGLDEGLSVPVSDSGVATLSLEGEAPQLSPERAELLLAQLAWTLRQDPDITAFRLSIGGEDVPLPGGATEYDLDSAAAFDPAGADSTGLLYGLRHGRLVVGGSSSLEPVEGPFGRERWGFTEVAVAPDAGMAAGVTADGGSVLVGPARTVAEDARVRTVFDGGTDLAQPVWDHANRLWLLDRPTTGAVLWSFERGKSTQVRFPGVSGEDARQLLVSRDGTRLIALVHGPEGDRLVAARVVIDGRGRVERVAQPATIWSSGGGPSVLDLAWTGANELGVIAPTSPRGVFEVQTLPVDGADVGVDRLTTLVTGQVVGLAGAPTGEVPAYVVLRRSLLDVRTDVRTTLGGAVRRLDYAG